MNYLEFSFNTRKNNLQQLQQGTPKIFEALIVGGGIVGAGLARELAIRGIQTLLVEKGDFASGTSSRSSKLIHGGLRYLEMFDFRLVFEALAERHWLLKTHPHLVHPLEFNLPIYEKKRAPQGSRGSFLLGLGLWLYDALSLFRTPFFHGKRSTRELLKLFPGLRSQGLRGSYYYADAMMLDDELVLECLLDACRRQALALNYAKVLKIKAPNSQGLYEVLVQDCLSQKKSNEASEPFIVHAKKVIVCVGPWTEQIGADVEKGSNRKLKPSRGVHLILPWKRFPVDRCLVMYAPDGRLVFAIPRKDLGPGAELIIIGTTDAPEKGSLDEVCATHQDVEYLLNVLKAYFPQQNFKPEDILMTYAGVRPLLDDGSKTEANTSREHEIWKNEAGVIFMAGGKYTTFRKISQEIADFAFPLSHKNEKESKAPLSTPEDYHARLSGKILWGKFTEGWVHWKLAHHAPCTLEDVVFRRLPLWMAGREVFNEVLPSLVEISQSYFSWSKEELNLQLQKVEHQFNKAFLFLK